MTPAVAKDGRFPLLVVLGPCDDMRAEVFVRVARPEEGPQSLRLVGEFTGPECRRSITLPAGAALTDLGPGESGLLAKAVLTEPAFWTPELPNLYQLTVRLVANGCTMAEATRRIGLRRSGVRGRSLWLEGRRWVPRGVARALHEDDSAVIRAAGCAVIADPAEPFLTAADEAGLAVIAVAGAEAGGPSDADAVIARIAGWEMHPSVAVAVLPESFSEAHVSTVAATVRRLKGTMLLGVAVPGDAPPPSGLPAGIDCVIVSLAGNGLPHAAWRDAAPAVPLIALQRVEDQGLADRSGCDRLQAKLAAWGLADGRALQAWDWAGYLVS